MTGDSEVLVRLPESLRSTLREPLGTVHPSIDTVLEELSPPVIAVGDVVTAALLRVDRPPDVAVVDGRTKRQRLDEILDEPTIAALERLPTGRTAPNPAGTLTKELIDALSAAITDARAGASGVQVVDVSGEEDLAALPAILLAPAAGTVVYGQPDEGVVAVSITAASRRRVRELLESFEGDRTRAMALLDPPNGR